MESRKMQSEKREQIENTIHFYYLNLRRRNTENIKDTIMELLLEKRNNDDFHGGMV
ncbi:MAG: hypothetical protein ACOCWO_04755 [Candidatus Muiribacteriaceae bacterium]